MVNRTNYIEMMNAKRIRFLIFHTKSTFQLYKVIHSDLKMSHNSQLCSSFGLLLHLIKRNTTTSLDRDLWYDFLCT